MNFFHRLFSRQRPGQVKEPADGSPARIGNADGRDAARTARTGGADGRDAAEAARTGGADGRDAAGTARTGGADGRDAAEAAGTGGADGQDAAKAAGTGGADGWDAAGDARTGGADGRDAAGHDAAVGQEDGQRAYHAKTNGFRVSNMPFDPSPYEVMYTEACRDEEINACIVEHLDLIRRTMAARGRVFVYLPLLGDELTASPEVWRYRVPWDQDVKPLKLPNFPDSMGVLNFMSKPQNVVFVGAPCLVRCTEEDSSREQAVYYRVQPDKQELLANAHRADYWEFLLDRLDGAAADYRIFLTDYQNREVLLTPLPKAVFLLFLRHPEGIRFKELPDYREELRRIYADVLGSRYNLLSRRFRKYDQSVQAATDPFDNSINEKCARIREAFLLVMHDDLACRYYITGPRGEPKRITLPRDMVDFDAPAAPGSGA